MRSFIVLFGLMLTNTAVAAVCSRPTPPEIPAHKPSSQRIERKLSREVAEYVSASAKYVVCFRDNGADAAAVAEQEYLALHAVSDLINRYETRVGASDSLIAEMAKLAGTNRPVSDVSLAAIQRKLDSDAVPTLNAAVAHVNAGRYAAARAAVASSTSSA